MQKSQRRQAGGIITILVVGLLLAVAAGLYIQLIMHPNEPSTAVTDAPETPASVRIVEGSASANSVDTGPVAETEKPLPEDQMAMIMQTFAPEAEN